MADGDARLEVVLEAKIDKLQTSLNKANQTIGGWAAKTQKDLDKTNSKWEKLFGRTDPAKALDKVFDSTRLKILDSGVARVGLFGSALEALGPAGLAGAAGVAAVAAAFAGAREAARFADEISDAATKAHVTTDALQELREALRLAGGDEHAAGAALEAFSATLGKAEAGVRKGLVPFRELFGKTFSAQGAKNLGGAAAALEKVTAALQGLPSEQKDAVITQLGLDGLKPLLEKGVDEMARLRDEARKSGLVMDAELVKRGGELNDKFETVSKVIDLQLKSALVDLGPIMLGLLAQMAHLASLAADVADAFKPIEEKRTQTLVRLRESFADRANSPLSILTGGPQADRNRSAAALGELLRRGLDPANQAPTVKPTGSLHDLTKHTDKPSDADARTASVAGELANAERQRLQAEQALTEDVSERANIERSIIAQELAGAEARLDRQKAQIESDKTLTAAKRRNLLDALETARWDEQQAAQARAAVVDRDEIRKSFDEWLEHNRSVAADLDATANAQADIADTAAESRRIRRNILLADQRIERLAQAEALARAVEDKSKTQGEASRELGAADERRAAQVRQFDVENAAPIERYRHSIQDLNSEIQNAGVSAIHSLSEGLADAIVNARSLGDVGRAVFRQLIQDVLQAVIEKQIGNTIANIAAAIPGFASGTGFAPGGLALVGERGPELVNLPRGASVTSNASTLAALQSMSVGRAPEVTFVQPVSFDLRGAVLTDDLLRQMNGIAARSAIAATAAARKLTVGDLNRQARRRL